MLSAPKRDSRYLSHLPRCTAGVKGNGATNARDHLYGHAAYTRLNAMLFNTTEILRALYASPS